MHTRSPKPSPYGAVQLSDVHAEVASTAHELLLAKMWSSGGQDQETSGYLGRSWRIIGGRFRQSILADSSGLTIWPTRRRLSARGCGAIPRPLKRYTAQGPIEPFYSSEWAYIQHSIRLLVWQEHSITARTSCKGDAGAGPIATAFRRLRAAGPIRTTCKSGGLDMRRRAYADHRPSEVLDQAEACCDGSTQPSRAGGGGGLRLLNWKLAAGLGRTSCARRRAGRCPENGALDAVRSAGSKRVSAWDAVLDRAGCTTARRP